MIYEHLIKLMDKLVANPEKNAVLIDLLFPIIERYEEESERFSAFNQRIDNLDSGVAMLRVIIDQHGLTLSDFPEIGDESLLLKILNGQHSLDFSAIKALSNRFGVPMDMFVK